MQPLAHSGRQIRLSGGFDDKGVAGGVGAVAVSAIVFAPAGFFMTGTSAKVPEGTVIKAFIDEDVPLAMPTLPAPLAGGLGSVTPAAYSAPAPQGSLAQADAKALGAQAKCWKD